jgi:hypothetical protein
MSAQRHARRIVRAWFALTAEERLFIAGLLTIILIGLAWRHAHLKGERAEVYDPTMQAAPQRDP